MLASGMPRGSQGSGMAVATFPGRQPRFPWRDLRWWMAAATFLVLAANTALGTVAAAAFLGIWCLHAAAWPALAIRDLASVRLPWLLPGLAVLSAAWSQAAQTSLRFGIQFLLTTVVGVLIARALPPARLVTSSIRLQHRAALEGLGYWLAFDGYVAEDVAAGRLVSLLEPWCPAFPGPFLYYPSRHAPPPLRAFVDFVRARRGEAAAASLAP